MDRSAGPSGGIERRGEAGGLVRVAAGASEVPDDSAAFGDALARGLSEPLTECLCHGDPDGDNDCYGECYHPNPDCDTLHFAKRDDDPIAAC